MPRNLAAFLAAVLAAALAWFLGEPQGGPDRGAGRDDVPAAISGTMKAVDGDSFHLSRWEVRLVGIDAPEGRQACQRDGRDWPCGREAANALNQMTRGKIIECDVEEVDRHGRALAVCRAGDTVLNKEMVERGWALSYGRYKREEAAARSARRGVWSGTFQHPREWRDRNMRQ